MNSTQEIRFSISNYDIKLPRFEFRFILFYILFIFKTNFVTFFLVLSTTDLFKFEEILFRIKFKNEENQVETKTKI
jgi:hypothetical protein